MLIKESTDIIQVSDYIKRQSIIPNRLKIDMKKKLLLVGCISAMSCFLTEVYSQETADKIYRTLFTDVQMERVFPDNKTFVDAIPKYKPEKIAKDYEKQKNKKGFSLLDFVKSNFEVREIKPTDYQSDETQSVSKHITLLWDVLKRPADKITEGNSLLPLPKDYIVPGGRFQEVYYWDTYFTMLGLQVDGENELIQNIVDNFDFLLKTYGHIPNGTRNYYLSRSQPPFFAMMVSLLAEIKENDVYKQYNEALQIEYNYWMDKTANTKHAVVLENEVVLNRYWDQLNRPRQESFQEDSTLMAQNKDKPELYRELRSGAESGWDFSSRWFTDPNDLSTIRCTDMIAVDLNALLYKLEQTLALSYSQLGNNAASSTFRELAKKRLEAINTYCYNPQDGWYYDYIISEGKQSNVKTLAGMMPFFVGVAPLDYIDRASEIIQTDFLRPGGVVTTANHSGQQWDAPNGWAPLEWITIKGLADYGKKDLAENIAKRWIDLNSKVYKNTGKLMEKYNVEDIGLIAGGGEYPAQDGFGWSNGVLQRLIHDYVKN